MKESLTEALYHLDDPDWRFTPDGDRRGYIQPQSLAELWFHTGTICNLSCPFCFEGANPGNNRLQAPTLKDVRPFIEEAAALGTRQFSFTGGEPFVTQDIFKILDFALDFNPCLVLTNATKPLFKRLEKLRPLLDKQHPLSFRVSLDFPDPEVHDSNRGAGNFRLSLGVMEELHRLGFRVSAARQRRTGEDSQAVDRAYLPFFLEAGGLAAAPAQVVELGPAHLAAAHYLYLLNKGGIERKGALDADAIGYVAYGETGGVTALSHPDDHSLEGLNAFHHRHNYLYQAKVLVSLYYNLYPFSYRR